MRRAFRQALPKFAGPLIGAACLFSSSGESAGGYDVAAAPARVVQLPLRFDSNRGQWDPQTSFIARGAGYELELTSGGATLTLPRAGSARGAGRKTGGAPRRVQLRVVGGRQMQPAGLDETPGRSNYFLGKDPSRWRTDVKGYRRVRYEGVKPGIDLLLYGTNQRALEYDLVLAPGTEPSKLALAFDGATDLRVGTDGELALGVGAEQIRQRRPVAYQEQADGGRTTVAVAYRQNGDGTIGFDVGPYDRARTLIIDPVLVYSTFLGGSGANEEALAVAVDAAGNTYVTGATNSADFPATSGAFQSVSAGGYDLFVTKLNASGTALVYSTFLGGSADDYGAAIAVDAAGNAYVAGQTGSADYPTTAGAFQVAFARGFVTKLSTTGGLVYSTHLGGDCDFGPTGIAADAAGNAYVVGQTCSFIFPTTPGAFQTAKVSPGSHYAGFVTKLNATGTGLIYSTYLSGERNDEPTGMALDAAGHVFVTGSTGSPDYPTTPGSYRPSSGQGPDSTTSFVTKLKTDGSGLEYSTFFGGAATVTVALAIDAAGNVYLTGKTFSQLPTTPGAFQLTNPLPTGSCCPAFVTKLNAGGSALVYSSYLSGSLGVQAQGVAVDSVGNAYVTGSTGGTDFPTTADAFQPTHPGSDGAAFLTKVNATGTALLYSTYIGGVGGTPGDGVGAILWGMKVDANGTAYLAGSSNAATFPTTPGAVQSAMKGPNDAIVAKLATVQTPPDG